MQNKISSTKSAIPDHVTRRHFLHGLAAASTLPMPVWAASLERTSTPDLRIHIIQDDLAIAPNHIVRTAVYQIDKDSVLRLPEGRPVSVEIVNTLSTEEWVHWHGLQMPAQLDGTAEEGSLSVSAGGTLRYTLPPQRSGFFYVHSHAMTCHDMSRGLYSGQFSPVYIQPRNDAGSYDREVFWTSHEWEPYMVNDADEEHSLEEMQHFRRDPEDEDEVDGWDVRYRLASVNGHALGYGDPIRVREGERVLIHLLNASATENIQVALPGHIFQVIAMDGNPVIRLNSVSTLDLGVGERIDAIVVMNAPGVWIFGSTDAGSRARGLGVVLEYAGHSGDPIWSDPSVTDWDYTAFCEAGNCTIGEELTLNISRLQRTEDGSERWNLESRHSNGQPHNGLLYRGQPYRLRLQNQSDEWHPMHLHRNRFELLRYQGRNVVGLTKDTLLIPPWEETEVLLTPGETGPALFHCHNQMHMEAGLQTLFTVR
jgi:FtsP/CotA-like multicopper oxidase with cupredoxin domain